MAKFSSTNPLLSSERINNIATTAQYNTEVNKDTALMSLQGTARKTSFLLVLTVVSALFTMMITNTSDIGMMGGSAFVVGIVAFIIIMCLNMVPKFAPVLAPVYAILEGYFLGVISAFAELKVPGVASQAALLTIIDAAIMFFCFSYGIIRVTEKFRAVVTAAGISLLVFYAVSFILRLCGALPEFLSFGSGISIVVNVIAVVVASAFLLLDFDNIASAHGRVPKVYEWIFGVGLLATLVWMYVEFLRLILQLSNRD